MGYGWISVTIENGGFVGVGPVEGLGIYGGYDFFYELLRVDATGFQLAPDPLDYRPDDILLIIRDDIIGTVRDYFAHLYGLN